MTDLLAIGASGLRAYRASLAAVGDNIANAQTQGYARRSVRLEEVAIGSASNVLYRNRARFDGVDVAATLRATDTWATADARLAGSAQSRASTVSYWMAATEAGLSDGEYGTGAALGRMFAAGDALAADPVSRAARSAFLASIDTAAQSIRINGAELSRVATGIGDAAQASVGALNSDLGALADLNLAIRRVPPGTTAHAELADQRDRLIDRISSASDVTVDVAADGSATLTRGSQILVANGQGAALALTIASDGRLSMSVTFASTTSPFVANSGSLGGLVRVAGTVADRRGALDSLAASLTTALNTWQANGRTPANVAGQPLLSLTGGAATMAMAISDPMLVAAADTSGVANGNALALSAVRTGSGSENQWATIVAAQAQATATARSDEARTSARRDTADAARDAVEGVDLDREAADLLRFQQAYEASARVIQMAKEAIDTILRLF